MRRIAAVVAVLLVVSACGEGAAPTSTTTSSSSTTTEVPSLLLVDLLEERPELSTFLDLAAGAGLMATLLDDGPYTLFAPTNAAFESADQAVLAELAADPEALRNILLYHMIPDRVPSAAVTGPGFATTMAGFNVDITPGETGLLANDVRVSEVDLVADNGIIHIVEEVLFIPSILDVLIQSGTFTQILDALNEQQLAMLDNEGPLTFIATNDVAFAGGEGRFREIIGNPAALDAWFMYHLIDGAVELSNFQAVLEIQTLFGVPLPIGERGEFTTLGGAEVVIADVPAFNGVIHIVDDLYFPPDPPTDGGNDGDEGEELEE